MYFEYCQEVATDFEKVLESDEEYDVIIYAGENMKALHAHLFVLCTRSQYFRTGFSKKWAEKKDGKFIFKKPNISYEIFKIILRFIYCGKIDFTNLQSSEVFELLMAVDELSIQTLINCIQEYLIKYKKEFLQQQCSVEILDTFYQHDSFTDLWNFSLRKICEEPEILFNSNKFINLSEHLLEFLLKQDDLNLDEILIWDGLIKWCLAQHSNISHDVKKWDKDNFTTMERTIHRFIPLIRFYGISQEDFNLKVFPYKKLLPDKMINNIFTLHSSNAKVTNEKLNIFNVQSPRKSKDIYDSTLINPQHFAIFSSWIEKENDSHYNARNIPYNFNLLYRASRDGNTAADFHKKCDNKGATIVIAKVTDSEQIVGGYNPLFWNEKCNTNKSTNDSFIFTLTDRTNFQTAKVSYSNGDPNSIQNYSVHGPVFGATDLYENNGSNWCSKSDSISYPKIDEMPIGKFYVDDYEVFQKHINYPTTQSTPTHSPTNSTSRRRQFRVRHGRRFVRHKSSSKMSNNFNNTSSNNVDDDEDIILKRLNSKISVMIAEAEAALNSKVEVTELEMILAKEKEHDERIMKEFGIQTLNVHSYNYNN
ncbi:BTB-domain-containing protein [Rhizophagus irregularis]|uniref:BTB-domain-containing protein n=1 Tax=Rhizophagus irregularis TaxID=588596 RepID=A0A2N1N8D0_9GLOM|nr:BTB-domain-containing protein [Rhizophagus irregularis]